MIQFNLKLNLKQSYASYTDFMFYDSTGVYSYENTGGWGSPNFSISNIQWAQLRILKNNAVLKEYDLLPTFNTALSINDLRFKLPYDIFGGIIPDGVYQVQYKVSIDPATTWDYMNTNNSAMYVGYFATWFVVQSAVFKRIALVPNNVKFKAIGNNFTTETGLLFSLLNACIAAAQYSNFSTFESILDTLNQILSFDNTWEIRKQ